MPSKPYVETRHDFQVMYDGTFTRYTLEGVKGVTDKPFAKLGIIRGFRNPEDSGERPPKAVNLELFYEKEDETGGVLIQRTNVEVPIENVAFSCPALGNLNSKYSTLRIFQTKPEGNARYRKLPHCEVIRAEHLCLDALKYLGAATHTDIRDFTLLNAWEANVFTPASEALSQLWASDVVARAISNGFSLYIHPGFPGLLLDYRGFLAGKIDAPGAPLRLENWASRFKDELETYGLLVA